MALSPNAVRVLEARYLRRDAARKVIETPEELFRRVARTIAKVELAFGDARDADRWQQTFEAMMASGDFLPNSPVLMNAGTPLASASSTTPSRSIAIPCRRSRRPPGPAGRSASA